MGYADSYRTSYSRALLKNASNGFNARYLDADDWDFIETVKQRGCVGYSLGAVYCNPNQTCYSGYRTEEDAVEAHALEVLYASTETPEQRKNRTSYAYFEVTDVMAERERQAIREAREEQKMRRTIERARRQAAYLKAEQRRKQELAELERENHEYTVRFNARELETARIEVDWAEVGAKIARDRIIAEASRHRREKRRALRAAERELQRAEREVRRANKFLRATQRRIDEYDSNGGAGYASHPGQNERDLVEGGGRDNLNGASSVADQLGTDDVGIAPGGHLGGTPGPGADPVGDGDARAPAAAD